MHAANLLGFDDFVPPYATASGNAVLKGVNYASAAAGIRAETGQQLVRKTNIIIIFGCNNLHI